MFHLGFTLMLSKARSNWIPSQRSFLSTGEKAIGDALPQPGVTTLRIQEQSFVLRLVRVKRVAEFGRQHIGSMDIIRRFCGVQLASHFKVRSPRRQWESLSLLLYATCPEGEVYRYVVWLSSTVTPTILRHTQLSLPKRKAASQRTTTCDGGEHQQSLGWLEATGGRGGKGQTASLSACAQQVCLIILIHRFLFGNLIYPDSHSLTLASSLLAYSHAS